MKLLLPKSNASTILHVFILDSTSTAGAGKTGLAYNTASLVAKYIKPGGTLQAMTLEDITTLGTYEAPTSSAHLRFKLVDDTNAPGLYEIHLHADTLATNNSIVIMLFGATGMAPVVLEIQLSSINVNDGVRAGMTALPNAAADAEGGLPISDAGGLDLDAKLANTNEITAARMGALTDLINGGRLDLLIDGIKTKTDYLPSATAGQAGGVFIAGTNAPVTITGSGNALTLTSTGANGHGLSATSNGSGSGIYSVGGSTGHGIYTYGGSTSGHGIYAVGQLVGNGIYAYGGTANGDGIAASGRGSGAGMDLSSLEVDGTTILTGAVTAPAGITADITGTITTATNVTTVNGIANNAITAAAIAADAIGASELAADAATEIGTAVWATAARTLTAATNITSTGGTTVPQTGDSFARIGANGASLSAIPWNAAWDAEVESECSDAIVAAGISAADIADAVWDESSAGHTDAGKAGYQVWTKINTVASDLVIVQATASDILGDTDNMPSDVTQDLMSYTGILPGGATSYSTIVKWLAAGVLGDVKDKPGGGYNRFSPDDGTTVVFSFTCSDVSPYFDSTIV